MPQYVDVKLRKDVSLSGKTFVTGFHGIGLVGYVTVRYLVTKLGAIKIGFILTESMPPIITMENGEIKPPLELYMYRNVVFMYAESPPTAKLHRFSRGISEWVVKSGFEKALLIGGLDSSYSTSTNPDDNLRIIKTPQYNGLKREVAALEDGLFVVGPLALLMLNFHIADFPALAVLPYASRDKVDLRASATAIQFVNQELGLDVNVDELILNAKRIEDEALKSAESRANLSSESLRYIM
ncbi:MAG: PAC2 family protein [Thermoprotei archaeon]